MHLFGIERRVAAQDVRTHTAAHSDHRGGGLVRRLLDPAGDGIPAAELLRLPGAQRLQAVRRDDVRDAVQQRRRVAREIGVPGVGVHDIRARDIPDDLEIHAHRLHGGVRRGEFTRNGI